MGKKKRRQKVFVMLVCLWRSVSRRVGVITTWHIRLPTKKFQKRGSLEQVIQHEPGDPKGLRL
jgi:hypothetical protein